MPQAHVDPEELRRFAQSLKQFNNDLTARMTVLNGQVNNLGATWRDREHDKFVEEFRQTMNVVNRFIQASEQHVPFLMKKAERIEDYLQQR
ncbi:WXG100 family type VII secretion target [Tautonia plasticadhaerens]|jgi:WXG100 family type VII secretion target|uniref:WXG100 family type VII secretion target n=1 Tax=Tautonia plasticadhaerens TaxID=2527974 RepID=A0A518H9F3_9BACT|nr:WXG100 family type VII secretion target [Tautonia plasticadhaerens]QDV37488.1 hypothetical protein ElP_54280 [Tautonia plasticadhaerens]